MKNVARFKYNRYLSSAIKKVTRTAAKAETKNLTEMSIKEFSVKFEIFGLEFTIKVKTLKKK